MAVAPPAPECIGRERADRLRPEQERDIGSPVAGHAPDRHDLQDVKRQRHRDRPAEPLSVNENPEPAVGTEHIEAPAQELAESPGLDRGRRIRFAGGDEGHRRDVEQNRADQHDRGGTGRKGQGAEQPVRRRRHAEREQAAAEEADREQPAAPRRGYGAGHDVVVGHRDDAADEGVERPERKKHGHDEGAGQRSGERQQGRDPDQAGGPAEGADHVERHAPPAALGEIGDEKLGEQPAVAQDGGGGADREAAAGQAMDQGGDDGARVDRRRAALEKDPAGRYAPEPARGITVLQRLPPGHPPRPGAACRGSCRSATGPARRGKRS